VAAPELRLDHGEIAKLLKTAFNAEVDALAAHIAEQAGEDAVVDAYTTDRHAAGVSVPSWQQARDGALSKACAKAGVEFVAKAD